MRSNVKDRIETRGPRAVRETGHEPPDASRKAVRPDCSGLVVGASKRGMPAAVS